MIKNNKGERKEIWESNKHTDFKRAFHIDFIIDYINILLILGLNERIWKVYKWM